jgi:hypothetical protein
MKVIGTAHMAVQFPSAPLASTGAKLTDRLSFIEFTAGENGGIACLLQTSLDRIKSRGVDSRAFQSKNRY